MDSSIKKREDVANEENEPIKKEPCKDFAHRLYKSKRTEYKHSFSLAVTEITSTFAFENVCCSCKRNDWNNYWQTTANTPGTRKINLVFWTPTVNTYTLWLIRLFAVTIYVHCFDSPCRYISRAKFYLWQFYFWSPCTNKLIS